MPIRPHPQACPWSDAEHRLLRLGGETGGGEVERPDTPDDGKEKAPDLTEADVKPNVESRVAAARAATAPLASLPPAATAELRAELRSTAPPAAPVAPVAPVAPGAAPPAAASVGPPPGTEGAPRGPEAAPGTQRAKFDKDIADALAIMNSPDVNVSREQRLVALVTFISALIGRARAQAAGTLDQPVGAPAAPGAGGPGGDRPSGRPRWRGGRGGREGSSRREGGGGDGRRGRGGDRDDDDDRRGRRRDRDRDRDDDDDRDRDRRGGRDRGRDRDDEDLDVDFERDDPKSIDDVPGAIQQEGRAFTETSRKVSDLQGERRTARAALNLKLAEKTAGTSADPDTLDDQIDELQRQIRDLTAEIRPLQTELRLINRYGRELQRENQRREGLLSSNAPADGVPALENVQNTVRARYPDGTDMTALQNAIRSRNAAGEIKVEGTLVTVTVPAELWTDANVKQLVTGLKVPAAAPAPAPGAGGPDAAPESPDLAAVRAKADYVSNVIQDQGYSPDNANVTRGLAELNEAVNNATDRTGVGQRIAADYGRMVDPNDGKTYALSFLNDSANPMSIVEAPPAPAPDPGLRSVVPPGGPRAEPAPAAPGGPSGSPERGPDAPVDFEKAYTEIYNAIVTRNASGLKQTDVRAAYDAANQAVDRATPERAAAIGPIRDYLYAAFRAVEGRDLFKDMRDQQAKTDAVATTAPRGSPEWVQAYEQVIAIGERATSRLAGGNEFMYGSVSGGRSINADWIAAGTLARSYSAELNAVRRRPA